MNDITTPTNELELLNAWKSDFTARMVGKSINKVSIPVYGLGMCWTCRKDKVMGPFQWYCSDTCQDVGEERENNV